MLHTDRPLQEKMTLFWHNHFATGYTKVAGHRRRGRSDALHGREAGRRSGRRARPGRNASANTRSATSATCSSTSPRTPRCCSGLMATRTRGRGRRRTSAARSWSCSRWASGTTPSPTSTRRRACSPAGIWRGRARAADGTQHYQFAYVAEQARHRREDVQLSDLSRRQQDDPGPLGRRRACRTASI